MSAAAGGAAAAAAASNSRRGSGRGQSGGSRRPPRRPDRDPPHKRYGVGTSWHGESELSDGTPVGRMGANWYILDKRGVPLPVTKTGYKNKENGWQSIRAVDDGEYIVNSGGSFGIWGRVRRVNGELHMVQSFKGDGPVSTNPRKSMKRPLRRLSVLSLPERAVTWAKWLFYAVIPLALLAGFLHPTLGSITFMLLPAISITLFVGGIAARLWSDDEMWTWDVS